MYKKYKTVALVVLLATVFLWIIYNFSYSAAVQPNDDFKVSNFNEGWVWMQEDQPKQLAELPAKLPIKRGEFYCISNVLPEEITDNMTLVICTTRQIGRVLIDDQCVMEFKNQAGPLFEKYPVSKVNYVDLKNEWAGHRIDVELVSYNTEYSGRVSEMYYGEYGECVRTSFLLQAPVLLLYCFINFIGILLMIIFFFIKGQKKKYMEVLVLGAVTVLLSMMVMTEYNMIQEYVGGEDRVAYMGLACVLVLPFVYLSYLYYNSTFDKMRKFVKGTAGFFAILCLIFCVYTRTGDCELGFWLGIYKILACLACAVSMCLLVVEICVDYRYSAISLFFALLIFLFTVVIETFSYFQNVISYRNFGVFLGAGMICALAIMGLAFTNKIIKMFSEHQKIQEELTKKRVDLMLGQIQPHFIYNTLNAIQALIEMDTQKASEMIYNFSRYLRNHVDAIETEGLIPFGEELENIQTYVNIELQRFPKIKVVYDIQDAEFLVPMLSIQPIVENAIRHGVSKKAGGGTIQVCSYKTNISHVIEVIDDGVGMKSVSQKEDQQKRSVGIKNITYRLNQLVNATVYCESEEGKGTRIRIDIPERGINFDENYFSGR